jgi:hypothetical protein
LQQQQQPPFLIHSITMLGVDVLKIKSNAFSFSYGLAQI